MYLLIVIILVILLLGGGGWYGSRCDWHGYPNAYVGGGSLLGLLLLILLVWLIFNVVH